MKQVMINTWQIGLVFKRGVYQRMLKEGHYWFWDNPAVNIYDVTRPFLAPVELNILLEDKQLADVLHVVEVGDHELVLHYENGLLKEVLGTGRYTFWKSVVPHNFVRLDTSKVEITEGLSRATLQHKLVMPFVRTYTVEQHEKVALFVDSKFVQLLDTGTHYWYRNNIAIHFGRIDVRQQQLEVNGQEILTRDKAALRINAWAQYRIVDIEKALMLNKEYDKQLYTCFQLALREYISTVPFDELLEKKDSMAPFILQSIREKVSALGVSVSSFGIRDIILPGDVKEIMNQVLIAEKKAQANTIMRREETASTRSLLNTAKLMEDNTMLWKLKEMEYVEKIADKISNISVNGSGVLVEQLKQLFVPQK